jgi:ribosome maturation factor RimP
MNPREKDAVESLVRKVVESKGFEVHKLTIGNDRHLHLTLDSDPGPITLKDCISVNRHLRTELELAGLPADDYAIDVESPGTDRELSREQDFTRFVGERIRIKLKAPLADGTAVVRGSLEGIEEGLVVVKPLTGPRFRLALDEMSEARLDPRY